MSTKITITVEEDNPIGLDPEVTSVTLSGGEAEVGFYERAFRAIMHAVQFHPDTISELFTQEPANECCAFGGTCCDDDETRCPAGCCGPDDELDLGPELVTDAGPNVVRPVMAAEADRIAEQA